MKYSMIYTATFLILFIAINSQNLQSEKKNSTETGYKTFLVKTQLTKQELETLLKQGETQIVNLKKNKTHHSTFVVNEALNKNNIKGDPLQNPIDQGTKSDTLVPLHEFHLKPNEVKTLVAKPNARFIDSLYEKRFGQFYGYLTLFLFIFVMIYYKDYIFNQKGMNINSKTYLNNFYNDSEKEYMLVKNN